MSAKAKNICEKCGGNLVVEYIGKYGTIYEIKKDGCVSKKRIKHIYYEEGSEGSLIYCQDCGELVETSDIVI